ncbi:MAG: hypothetical protein K0V04_03280 [Deltaproteobacteria bacterium]|nr:hypothetical protein [Deltaproteobacteria bacterium]
MLPILDLRAVLASFVLASTAACVLVDSDTGSELSMLRSQQRVQANRVAVALCESYYACGCEERFPDHESEAECVKLTSDGLVARLEQGIDRGLEYDPSCLDTYAELAEGMGCTAEFDLIFDAPLFALISAADGCRTYFGINEDQQGCTRLPTAHGDSCASNLYCHPEFDLCVTETQPGVGNPCSDNGFLECGVDLYCAGEPSSGDLRCAVRPGPGEPCPDNSSCSIHAACELATETCVALPLLGEPCLSNVLCDFGLQCVEGICIEGSANGEACGVRCGLGLTCNDDEALCEPRRPLACDLQDLLP